MAGAGRCGCSPPPRGGGARALPGSLPERSFPGVDWSGVRGDAGNPASGLGRGRWAESPAGEQAVADALAQLAAWRPAGGGRPPWPGATRAIAGDIGTSPLPGVGELGQPVRSGLVGSFANYTGSFAGGAFGRREGRALAACAGDTWVASGRLPRAYRHFDPAEDEWGEVRQFEDGFAYLVTGDANAFELVILTDDAGFASRAMAETYCGYGIVTRVSGRTTRREWSCCYDDQVICGRITVKLSVERAMAVSGEMVPVFWGWMNLELYLGNYAHPDYELFRLVEIGRVRGGTRQVSLDAVHGSSADLAWATFWTYSQVAHVYLCTAAGATVGVSLNDLLYLVWQSAPGDPELAAGPYAGGASADVPHALYLLSQAEVWDAHEDWFEALSCSTPIDCGADPGLDVPGEPDPGSAAGP